MFFVTQAIKAQSDRDNAVQALVDSMAKMFSFMELADPASRIKPVASTVEEMTKKTVECVMFIRTYTQRGFAGMFS